MLFGVLGPVEVLTDGGAQVPLGSGRERLVLAMLVLGADRLVPTERLIDVLWTDPPPTAKQQLQNLIAGLRRRLASQDRDLVATRPFGYQLRMGPHRLDVVEFRRLVAEARGLVEAGDPEGAAHALEQALDIWRGSPLSDAAPASPDTEVSTLVQSLHDERVSAIDLLVESLGTAGLHDRVLSATASHLHHDPWNERLHAHRLRALAAAGRRSEAGEEYRRLRRTFLDELGVEPGSALADLNVEILEGRSVVVPLPRAASRPRPVPRELPALAWTLVGRDDLLSELVGHLRVDPDDLPASPGSAGPVDSSVSAESARAERAPGGRPRVVVLVGVGGVGKTALAVAAGHSLGDAYPDGTLHAALGHGPRGSADVHDVAARFLRALGVDQSAVPADPDERISLYRSTIDRKRLLVVLDDAVSEAQVRRLLPTGPGSAAIVTSRSKLAGLLGVRRHTVPPLRPEDAAGLIVELAGLDLPARTASDMTSDAASGEASAAATVVAEISALCGHLPLALCVAGAKLATNADLDLDELRDRLSGEHARLDELSVGDIDVRASIGASVGDLGAPSATLFARLGVTSGEWPEWVPWLLMGDGVSRGEARQALDQLVDRHLVEPCGRDGAGQARFRMHGLVVELSRERLLATEGPAARDELALRLDTTWLELALVAEAHLGAEGHARTAPDDQTVRPLTSAPSRAPIDWFEAERINLTAAVLGAISLEERELAARLALALRAFLTVRAYDDERERVLRLALDDYPETCDQTLLALLLGALFGVLAQARRFAELPEVASRRLVTARTLGDPALEQSAMAQAAWAALVLNRFDEALGAYAAVAVLAEQRGDERGRAAAHGQRGVVLRNMGRPADGDPLLAMTAEASRHDGSSPRQTCIWLVTRSEGLLDLGHLEAAVALLTEALGIAESLRDELGAAHCRLALGRAYLLQGSLDRARQELEAARPQLDAHAVDREDLDCLRLAVDLDTAAGQWIPANEGAHRLVHARRAEGDDLQLACDLARLARLRQHLDPTGAPGGGTESDEEADEVADEVAAILRRLGLAREALRLPPLTTGGPWARC